MIDTSPVQSLILDEAQHRTVAPDGGQRPGAATGEAPPLQCEWVPWGPETDDARPPLLLATLGSIELEYAALHRGVGRFDAPHRRVIRVTGDDRVDLLDRLCTQRLAEPATPSVHESFLTARTGRVIADMVIVHTQDDTWIELDALQGDDVLTTVQGMVFAEDVNLHDMGEAITRIDLFGPAAFAVLAAMGFDLLEADVAVQGEARAWRMPTGTLGGASLAVPAAAAADTWRAIDEAARGGGHTCRTVGWYALNMARVEAHEPVANIDFGPGNLPAETGVLHRRVSFAKGCYPGQEVVARMHNLGHPKQVLRVLHMPGMELPVAGSQVFAADDVDLASPLGQITSSAPAPMASQRGTALAMLRWKIATVGDHVQVMCDGAPVKASVVEVSSDDA